MFMCVNARDWVFSSSISGPRLHRLRSTSFVNLTKQIAQNCSVYSFRREGMKANQNAFRLNVVLEVDQKLVDIFHNGACGYRAQFYCGLKNGESANHYFINAIKPIIMKEVSSNPKRTCPVQFVDFSVSSKDAKAWIHQSRTWIRPPRLNDRNLSVWIWHSNHKVLKSNGSLSWGSPKTSFIKNGDVYCQLTPDRERFIDIKGAFATLGCTPVPPPKQHRSEQLRDCGFT